MDRKTLLITGAAGRLGGFLRPALRAAGYRLLLMDVRRVPQPQPGETPVHGSVTNAAILAEACGGVAGIVHLAGFSTGTCWPDLLHTNVQGTWQVLDAARVARVPAVVMASSHHATGFTPRERQPLPDDVRPRPDSLHGVSRATLEALGSYYADVHEMHVVCLRMGTCAAKPPDQQALTTWLSPDDAGRLVLAALTTPNRGFHLVWGVSANTRRWWSTAGGDAIGYHPKDDAEPYAATMPGHTAYTAKPGRDGILRVSGSSASPAAPNTNLY